jgi:hypothetical protein
MRIQPTLLKQKDASLEEVYSKYNTRRGKHNILIPAINDSIVWFATQLLACKIIHKCRKEECPIEVVLVVEHCIDGNQMAWAPYLFK